MNYRALKNQLNTLTEEQLDMPVQMVLLDEPLVKATSLFILDEDMINPSGEGCEPVSNYCLGCDHESDDGDCAHDSPVLYRKGEVFLEGEYARI